MVNETEFHIWLEQRKDCIFCGLPKQSEKPPLKSGCYRPAYIRVFHVSEANVFAQYGYKIILMNPYVKKDESVEVIYLMEKI